MNAAPSSCDIFTSFSQRDELRLFAETHEAKGAAREKAWLVSFWAGTQTVVIASSHVETRTAEDRRECGS